MTEISDDRIHAAFDAYEKAVEKIYGRDAYQPSFAAMRAAIAAADEAAWMPMATAPRDGTLIEAIVWVIHRPTKAGHWDRNFIKFDEETGQISNEPEYTGWEWDDYSFWRPANSLPEPPKETT